MDSECYVYDDIGGVEVRSYLTGDRKLDDRQLARLARHVKEECAGQGRVTRLVVKPIDGDSHSLSLDYAVQPPPFRRIRRITGYLTGDTSRWNNAKQAELKDRVKHM